MSEMAIRYKHRKTRRTKELGGQEAVGTIGCNVGADRPIWARSSGLR